jgi:hypothetical protein
VIPGFETASVHHQRVETWRATVTIRRVSMESLGV